MLTVGISAYMKNCNVASIFPHDDSNVSVEIQTMQSTVPKQLKCKGHSHFFKAIQLQAYQCETGHHLQSDVAAVSVEHLPQRLDGNL